MIRFDSPGSRALLASALDAIIAVDASGRVVEWNPAAERVFGYTRNDAIGASITGLIIPPESRSRYEAVFESIELTGSSSILGRRVALEALRSDGARICIEMAVDAVAIQGNTVLTAFIRDITERRRAEQEQSRLEAIVRCTSDAIVSFNPQGRFSTWNKGAEALFGYTAEEVIGQDASFLIPRNISLPAPEGPRGMFDWAMAEGQVQHETVRRRKDGNLVHVWGTAARMEAPDGGPLGVSAIFRDITERKQAEERQRVMMYELDHRVRNTLAIVQSIASHTLRAAGVDRTVASTLSDRLVALAGAHAILSDERWDGGTLDEIVAKAISVHERIRVAGPRIWVRPELVVVLSLVLHELATNAAKHGALSNETGWVDLTWRVADDRLFLSWREKGGPATGPPDRRGFGLQLIERLIGAQAEASFSTRYQRTGAEVDIALRA